MLEASGANRYRRINCLTRANSFVLTVLPGLIVLVFSGCSVDADVRQAEPTVETAIVESTTGPDTGKVLVAVPPSRSGAFSEYFEVVDLDVEPAAGSVYETLLSKLPDNVITRGYTRMGDTAGVIDALGFESLAPGYTGEELKDFMKQFSNRSDPRLINDGFTPTVFGWPNNLRVYVGSLNLYPDLAFDQASVDSFALSTNSQPDSVGGQLREYEVALGSFNPDATLKALNACDCDAPDIRTHLGVDYFVWGDGRQSLDDRLKRPFYDHIGRGPHLLVRDGEAYYAVHDGVIDEHLDVIEGGKSSLADVDDYVAAVQWMASMGVIREITLKNYGFTLETASMSYLGDQAAEQIVQGVPLLLPFEMAATGIGFDGERQFLGLVIAHDDEELVEPNVTRLLARFSRVTPPEEYMPEQVQPNWYQLEKIELLTSGRFLVARLYFSEPPPGWMLIGRNVILVHE